MENEPLASVEQIQPRVESAEIEPIEPVGEAPPVEEIPAIETPPAAPEQAALPKPANRWKKAGPWLAAGGLGLVTLCLSVVLALGILGLVNGGLAYAPRSKTVLLESQLAGIYVRLDEQDRDLAALRDRLKALETLNGQVAGLEQESQSLRQEMDRQTASMQALEEEIARLQEELDQVAGRSRDFETFLQGLAELLAGLQTTQEAQP